MQLPAIAKILSVFALIVFANSRGLHLGTSAVAGAVLAGLWASMGAADIAGTIFGSLLSADTLLLSLLLVLILTLGTAMKNTRHMEAIASSYRSLVASPRIAVATLPSVIGVLPMPGGAVFSAPMVEAIDEGNELGPDGRAVTNYWFRHQIELMWPLYPAFILSSALSGLSIPVLMAANAYSPFFICLFGILFLLRRFKPSRVPDSASLPRRLATFLRAFSPILLVLAVSAGIEALVSVVRLPTDSALPVPISSAMRRYGPTIVGIVAAIAFTASGKKGGVGIRAAFFSAGALKMIGTVAGIKAFAAVIGAAGFSVLAAAELASAGVPAFAVTAAVPFVAGLVTGIGLGYVGLAFPIVLALDPSTASLLVRASTVSLAGAFGFVGMMLSPLHVCMAVSVEHFKIRTGSILRAVALPGSAFLLVACAWYALLRML